VAIDAIYALTGATAMCAIGSMCTDADGQIWTVADNAIDSAHDACRLAAGSYGGGDDHSSARPIHEIYAISQTKAHSNLIA
jgi:hypothetical protein